MEYYEPLTPELRQGDSRHYKKEKQKRGRAHEKSRF